jgi:hypothetical protein
MKSIVNQIGIKTLQILNWIFFIVMVGVNYLANALPINGKNTGQLSDQYPNLFVPAGITFAIWGVIYLLLLLFCVVQSKGFFSKTTNVSTAQLANTIGLRFIITCILNAAWIFTWHYEHLFFSIIIMVSFLIQLIDINLRINKKHLADGETIVSPSIAKSAFGIYLGWICIATIANSTAVLVFFGWNGFGQSEVFWTCLMVLIGAFVASWTLLKLQNGFIGIVVIWAFLGIIIKRIEATEYQRFIVWITVFAIIIVTTSVIFEMTKSAFRKV